MLSSLRHGRSLFAKASAPTVLGARKMSGKPQDDDDSPLHPWSGSKLPPLRIRAKGAYVIQVRVPAHSESF
eukprot:1793956-Rhodomonas_salina.1